MNKSNLSLTVSEFSVKQCLENFNLWKELIDNSNYKFIYNDYKWYQAFWKTYEGIYNSKIYVVIDNRTKSWFGILPTTLYKTGFVDLYTKIIAPSTSEYSDYFSPIIRNKYVNRVLPILLKKFFENYGSTHLFKLINVIDDKDMNSIIIDTLNQIGLTFKVSTSLCPVLLLEGNEKSKILNSFKKKHRDDIKRQTKKLKGLGDLSFKVFENKLQFEENFYQFLNMYKNRWENSNQISSMSKSKNELFFKTLLNTLDISNIHFSGLFLECKPIAYHIGFYHNNWFYYYKPTYDIEYSNFSPGKIHIWYLIKRGCEEGWEGFDFLQGFEVYKKNWNNHTNSTFTYTIHKKNWIRFYWQIRLKDTFLKIARKIPDRLIFFTRTFINKSTTKISQ